LRPRDRVIAIAIASFGLLACGWLVAGFFRTIVYNRLPWTDVATAQEHYLAVGESYGRGFATGFFLCFFLAIAAVSISAWARDRRRTVTANPVQARRREDRAAHPQVAVRREASPYPATSRQ